MANGDRRNIHHLFVWQRYAWARNAHGVENSARVALPVVSAITPTSAVVTVTTATYGGRLRVLYGRSHSYECRTAAVVQGAPGAQVFQLLDLLPASTYYVLAIQTAIGTSTGGGDISGLPACSPEASFVTTGSPILLRSDSHYSEVPQEAPPSAEQPSIDGVVAEPVPV